MFEPITISLIGQSLVTSQVISSVIGGVIGNQADNLLCGSIRTVYQRFVQQPNNPVNHDIQRAVREAYLKAALIVCDSFRREKYDSIDRIFHFPAWDLKEVVSHLRQELKNVHKRKFVPPQNVTEADHITLLKPQNIATKKRLNELQHSLKEALLQELQQANLYIEDDLKQRILQGWIEDSQALDWFDLMLAYFAEIQKTNERVRTAVQNDLLLDIQQQVQGIGDLTKAFEETLSDFQTAMESFLPRINEFIGFLEKIEKGIDEIKDDTNYIRTRLDELVLKRVPDKYLNSFAHYDISNLIGRELQLKAIGKHFTQHQLLLLHGIGGIGKTTLAKAYISQTKDKYDHIAYVEMVGTYSGPQKLDR